MSYWDGDNFLHGPKLACWVKEHVEPAARPPTLQRALHAWEHGRNPRLETVDTALVPLGIHPSEVPEDAWVK